ncbi:hydantoinase/oxoprolinase family protein [Alteribacillus sp. YIM 98480]|uniref:hydantoinase/oxoprolinase family protein n=1 Tax=Alteribacillus sp. YIM 98480 TaxID=2606599 RepID=UPI00131E691A|nr:hydantoinase/oxoprolinase family protein [Alteribacillus sp. YIM 98480]
MGYKLGVDVGGTFTDLCLFDEEEKKNMVLKLPSTPQDPSKAIIEGIKNILSINKVNPNKVNYLVHGTTVGTNAAIERKGAKTALITTEGFRDLLELARQTRPSIYDLYKDKPEPIVKRNLRKEVTERLRFDGTVEKSLNKEQVSDVLEEMLKDDIEAVSVCFMHSYLNPAHEKEVKQIIQEILPDVYVSVSSEVLPEYREYERLMTTTLNSYLGPVVSKYVNNFAENIKEIGIETKPYINQSNSGVMSIEVTKNNPVRTALSGPSAGVAGAAYIAKLAGFEDIITFDMGGTSTDVSLMQHSIPKVATGKSVAGFPVQVPMTDVHAVGAGGGSIAWIDNGGVLKVGPHSAGASPGPAAYDKGGTEPTVTDANVFLKRLNPEYILEGSMPINYAAANEVIEDKLSVQTGLSVIDAAKGILKIVNSNMMRAIRVVSVEQGHDPREFTLVAFGGAGALHAAHVAKELGIKKVLVPDSPGILCAVGLLASDLRMDFVKTERLKAAPQNLSLIDEKLNELITEAKEWLLEEGVPMEQQMIDCKIDIRYVGQNYELSIPIKGALKTEENLKVLQQAFHSEHEKAYGYANEREEVECINYRVIGRGATSKINLRSHEAGSTDASHAVLGVRNVYFDEVDAFINTKVYQRKKLKPNNIIEGPAIVEQMDSTTVIPPHSKAQVDLYKNIIINL